MSQIFICYRREDTSGHAGRLYDHLRTRYGEDVFMDIDAIGPGVDYAKLIDETLSSIKIVLVVIGQHWLDASGADGMRRLEAPDDLVRQEVAEALAADVLVIPVLVQGATLPGAEQLPPDLVSLARRNAIGLSDERWRYDADRLVEAIDAVLSQESRDLTQTIDTKSNDRMVEPAQVTDRRGSAGFSSWSNSKNRTLSMVLAAAGGFLVLTFGFLVLPGWHNEQNGFRVVVALGVVAVAVVGLVTRRSNWVMYAGIAGLIGFAAWLLALLPGHIGSGEVGELLSPEYDGITNLMVFAGSALLFAGGWLARTASDPTGESSSQEYSTR